MRSRSIVCVALVAILAPSGPAAAEPDPVAEARRIFATGRQAFAAARYDVAAAAFEESYRLLPEPEIAFSAAQAHRLQYFVEQDGRRLERARDLYHVYVGREPSGSRRRDAIEHLATVELLLLSDGPPDTGRAPAARTELLVSSTSAGAAAEVDGANRVELPALLEVTAGRHRIQAAAPGHASAERSVVAVAGRLVHVEIDLTPLPARLSVRGSQGAQVFVDGRRIGEAPMPRPTWVAPGEHFVEVLARGRHHFGRRILATADQDLRLDVTLRTTRQRVLSYYFLGTSSALLIAGGVTAALALAADARAASAYEEVVVDRHRNFTQEELAAYSRSRQQRGDLVVASYGLAAGAAALGLAGLLLHWLDMPSPGDD